MNRSACLLLACLAPAAHADRLIEIPLGKKLTQGLVRGEALFSLGDSNRNKLYLGAGLDPHFEIEAFTNRLGTDDFASFNLQYNQVAPIPDLNPGLSIGVLDALDRSPERRRAFFAATFRTMSEVDVPLEVTVGVQTKFRQPFFAGAMLPFTNEIRVLAEHDGTRIAAGGEYRTRYGVAFRLIFQEKRTSWSVSLTRKL